MANRSRDYYRKMRKKHIDRKKRIIHMLRGYWYYKYEGELSKEKIHCSCWMCSAKTSVCYKPSEQRKIESMKEQLVDL